MRQYDDDLPLCQDCDDADCVCTMCGHAICERHRVVEDEEYCICMWCNVAGLDPATERARVNNHEGSEYL